MRTINNLQAGALIYCTKLEEAGSIISFEKSLIASLKGCSKPIILTLLGPLRSWE